MSAGWRRFGFLIVFGFFVAAAVATQDRWRPFLSHSGPASESNHSSEHDHHQHAEPPKSLVLSDGAKASLGLELAPIVLQEYWRSVPIPAEVMEEPGHCEQGISSAVHGVVTKIYAFHGQTVHVGDPLFDVRPTSELLAATQSSLLKAQQELELVQKEIDRITPLVEKKDIPATRLIEKQNEYNRHETQRHLMMQELLVRGLSADQIDEIVRTKTLIRQLTIRAPRQTPSEQTNEENAVPDIHKDVETAAATLASDHEHGSTYTVEEMFAHIGKLVQPGDELCRLARHSQLLIAGRAFERENVLVTRAIEKNWPVKAIFESTDESPMIREGLSILYSDNVIESDSRTIRFYIRLPNELLRDLPAPNGVAYRSWRFKPGQRLRVLLPVEHLEKQIVLPAEAIAKEGSETFVFRANGKKLERVPVRLRHLDSRDAVVEKTGTLVAGDVVARNQAYQLELALKNSQGSQGGHDHHGHDHGHSHDH